MLDAWCWDDKACWLGPVVFNLSHDSFTKERVIYSSLRRFLFLGFFGMENVAKLVDDAI